MTRAASTPERGSALMLVPAMVLVLVVLGAIAVDFAVVFLAQRDLANRAAGAANDIAGFAVSDERFYRDGRITLSEREANDYVRVIFAAAAGSNQIDGVDPSVEVGDRTVTVRVEGRVRYIFAPALPGVAQSAVVRAASTAEVVGGDEK